MLIKSKFTSFKSILEMNLSPKLPKRMNFKNHRKKNFVQKMTVKGPSLSIGSIGIGDISHSNRDLEIVGHKGSTRSSASHLSMNEKGRRGSKLAIPFGMRGIPITNNKLPPLNDNDRQKIPKYNSCDNASSQSSVGANKLQNKVSQVDKFTRLFTQFIQQCYSSELSQAIEFIMTAALKATQVIFWQDVPSVKQLYSKKLGKSVPYQEGLVGHTYTSKKFTKIDQSHKHSSWNSSTDGLICPNDTPVLLFPLWDHKDNIVAIVEATRQPKDPFFGQDIEDFVDYFAQQFKLYSKWLLPSQNPMELIQDMVGIVNIQDFLVLFKKKISSFFSCRSAEIWRLDAKQNKLQRFADQIQEVELTGSGIVGHCLLTDTQLNCQNIKWHKAYNEDIDGKTSENLLIQTHNDVMSGMKWAIVLRGSTKVPIFTNIIEDNLKTIIPIISVTLENSLKFSGNNALVSQNDDPDKYLMSHPGEPESKYLQLNPLCENELERWIEPQERESPNIPQKLVNNRFNNIYRLDFLSIDWNGIGLFQMAFKIFDDFGVLAKFKVRSELFFRFLYKLKNHYNNPPYHNWIHALDVLQYVAFELKNTKSHNHLADHELFAVLVAALCHDVGHQGFNNPYNINVQTPIGILFKDTSVMETFHCAMAIRILQEDDTNIFFSLSDSELTAVWRWIIHLILATDMAKHFKLIKEANETLEQRSYDFSTETDRLTAMELLVKVADISNVSRPFPIADEWCDVLSDEFWRQGDEEKRHGLDYSSPLMKKGGNKAKGQIGFYKAVCIPLYALVARIFPELQVSLDSVNANLKEWENIAAQSEN